MYTKLNEQLFDALKAIDTDEAEASLRLLPVAARAAAMKSLMETKDNPAILKSVLDSTPLEKRYEAIYPDVFFKAAEHPLSFLALLKLLPEKNRIAAVLLDHSYRPHPIHTLIRETRGGSINFYNQTLIDILTILPQNDRIEALYSHYLYDPHFAAYLNVEPSWEGIRIENISLFKDVVALLPEMHRYDYIKFQLEKSLVMNRGADNKQSFNALIELLSLVPPAQRLDIFKMDHSSWLGFVVSRHGAGAVKSLLDLLPSQESRSMAEELYKNSCRTYGYQTYSLFSQKTTPESDGLAKDINHNGPTHG